MEGEEAHLLAWEEAGVVEEELPMMTWEGEVEAVEVRRPEVVVEEAEEAQRLLELDDLGVVVVE